MNAGLFEFFYTRQFGQYDNGHRAMALNLKECHGFVKFGLGLVLRCFFIFWLVKFMGNSESKDKNGYINFDSSIPMSPISGFRPAGEKLYKKPLSEEAKSRKIVKGAFFGVWSMTVPDGPLPVARTGQCYVYDAETESLVIAYGRDFNGNYLNDCWKLDLKNFRWSLINSALLKPRTNVSAVLLNRLMIMFGGSKDTQYFGELHGVDVETGEMIVFDGFDSIASPRMNSQLFVDSHSVYIWSGYDGRTCNDLIHYDIQKQTYTQLPVDMVGRSAASSTPGITKKEFYIFGSAKIDGLVKFCTKDRSFHYVKCTGTEPPTGLCRVAMVVADEFLFVIGGQRSCDYTYVLALDIKRNHWFPFHIKPDGKTVSVEDGRINKSGFFLLPREHSAALGYSNTHRALVSVMGSHIVYPPTIQMIKIGNALGILHLRSDLLDMLMY